MALEDQFKEPISDEEAAGLKTVGDTVEFIARRMAAKGGSEQ
jgi:acyl carrier protein